jgi:hypothetical protein
MEHFADLMQKLAEVQCGARARSPELIKEDAELMDRLQKRTLAERSTQVTRSTKDGPAEQARFTANSSPIELRIPRCRARLRRAANEQ